MPQIGWFEILIIVLVAILVIGPKDFPHMVRKIGKWIGTIKKYFSDIQKNVSEAESSIEDEITFKNEFPDLNNDKNKDE